MGLFSKPCQHISKNDVFKDLHTGGDGEIYVRSESTCRDCGQHWWTAVRLPDVVTEVLHEHMNVGTITRKHTPERAFVADALLEVYGNIDQFKIAQAVNQAIRTEMQAAFDSK